MKIKSVSFKNFRQFRDFNIEFDISDPEKNVTVIRARNSTGKTTFTQGILWCLYGDDEVDLDFSSKLINNLERRNGLKDGRDELDFSVELNVDDKGNDITLLRKQTIHTKSARKKIEEVTYTYKKNGETFIETATNKEPDKMNVINKKINALLSKEIANNFLFDGERIGRIASKTAASKNEISNAISSITQLSALEMTLSNLKLLEKRLRNSDVEVIDNSDLSNINEQINKYESDIETTKNTIISKKQQLRDTKEEFDQVENDLSNYSDIAKHQEIRTRLDAEERKLEEEVRVIKDEIFRKYVKYNHRKYVRLLHKKYSKIEIFDSQSSNAIPDVTEHSIDHLIERGICICGTQLNHENIYNLNEQKKHQPPITNESYINSHNIVVERESSRIDELIVEIKNEIAKFHKKQSQLNNVQQELIDIDRTITKSTEKKVIDLNERRSELLDKKTSLAVEIKRAEENLDLFNDELETLKNDFTLMRIKKSDSDLFLIKSDILTKSINKLESHRNASKNKLRIDIEKVANKHFSEIITKDKNIVLNEDFTHKIINENGEEAALSSGEDVALSFSIILAIIETHKDLILNKKSTIDKEILYERDFFLVMDGPFAVLDQHFTKDIAIKIADSVQQIILLTNDNQYNESVKKNLEPRLSREFILEAPEEEGENLYTKHLEVVK